MGGTGTDAWESAALRPLGVGLDDLAESIATDLDDPGPFVTELVRELLETLDASLTLDAPDLLADHLQWQTVRLGVVAPRMTRGELLDGLRASLGARLDGPSAEAVDSHLDAALAAEGGAPPALDHGELSDDAAAYLERVLHGDRDGAVQVVRDALAAGTPASEVMLTVLQPVQVEIGDRWAAGRVSVAHEHLCTAVTQLCMGLLYAGPPQAPTVASTAVTTSVGREAHEVGLRIVSDLLERDGWRIHHLGAGVPSRDVIALAAEQQADLVAVSATMPSHLTTVKRLIAGLRGDPATRDVKVVVGGRPFGVAPRLAEQVGADGVAVDAADAVAVCNALVGRVPAAG